MRTNQYLLLSEYLTKAVVVENNLIERLQERHAFKLITDLQSKTISNWYKEAKRTNIDGVVIVMDSGMPDRIHLKAVARLIKANIPVWCYWPEEQAIEYFDSYRLTSYKRLWFVMKWLRIYPKVHFYTGRISRLIGIILYPFIVAVKYIAKLLNINWLSNQKRRFADRFSGFHKANPKMRQKFSSLSRKLKSKLMAQKATPVVSDVFLIENYMSKLIEFSSSVQPVEWKNISKSPNGAYLRLDFWAKLKAGGSYGHTCYVAHELAKRTNYFCAFMANRYDLLDQLQVNQVELGGFNECPEQYIVEANEFYYQGLKVAVDALKPAYVYERICLGNYVGAKIANELKIPYFVEYNGSEIAMKRSFDNDNGYEFESYYLEAEAVAFKQATVISVISEVVADQLVQRNVPRSKILVNPNGVNVERYRPGTDETVANIKKQFGWDSHHQVIGFVGTFGGWHGIEVLAEAIPVICKQNPNARFLLIGDGNLAHLIRECVQKHKLDRKVVLTGILPQDDAIPLLQACDIYVSPHSAEKIAGMPFFGSPTKLFEYMSLGKGIVASNLMQIGDVLKPAIFAWQLPAVKLEEISNQRALLCAPGSVEDFTNGVLFLLKNPEIATKLGNNARQAAIDFYSWEKHIDRLFAFANGEPESKYIVSDLLATNKQQPRNLKAAKQQLILEGYEQEDLNKQQVQNQWDNDPCGSHYVKNSQQHTLDWYLEAERYRYREYAPWMFDVMEFSKFSGMKLLEIGGGMGTDLAQFAKHGAIVTDLDLSKGHLQLAQENFQLRGLDGTFRFGDAEKIPFDDHSFDVVYSNGVIHHSPNTEQIIREIYRVLKPGGKIKIMVYAENSINYWYNQVNNEWWKKSLYETRSIGDLMSGTVEISESGARPLVKVYTAKHLRKLFANFDNIQIVKQQLTRPEVPSFAKHIPFRLLEKLAGWNLIVTAEKPKR